MRQLIAPAFLLMVTLLALGEIGARLFFAPSLSGRFEYGYSPDAGFVEHPDGRVDLVLAGGRRFYPQSFPKQRPPGVLRIFVIGDSVTRGPDLKQAYPWLLERELAGQGLKAEVLNLGVAGNGARRSQIILAKALHYDPSLIILHLSISNEYEDEREYRRSQEFQGWHPRHWPMKLFIFRRLYEAKVERVFWRLIPQEIRQRFAVRDADAELAASLNPAKKREWEQRVAETTAASVALAQKSRLPLILLTQSGILQAGVSLPRLDDEGLDDLAKPLTGGNVLLLSMKEVFTPTNFSQYFVDTAHLNEPGHLLLARALAGKVKELLPRYAGKPPELRKTDNPRHPAEK